MERVKKITCDENNFYFVEDHVEKQLLQKKDKHLRIGNENKFR